MEVGATPQALINQLNTYIMKGHHGHGDVLTCKAIPDTEHDVIADVVLVAYLDEATKVNELLEVEDRIRAAFRETAAYPEMTRAKPESRFSLSLLGTEIHTNHGAGRIGKIHRRRKGSRGHYQRPRAATFENANGKVVSHV